MADCKWYPGGTQRASSFVGLVCPRKLLPKNGEGLQWFTEGPHGGAKRSRTADLLNAIIRKTDVGVSKNYLAEAEIHELNRLTTILLDIFEDQLDMGRLVVMQDAQTLLDQQLRQLGRTVLRSGGRVSAADAKKIADKQYEKFDKQRKIERQQEADERITALAKEVKKLPKKPRR